MRKTEEERIKELEQYIEDETKAVSKLAYDHFKQLAQMKKIGEVTSEKFLNHLKNNEINEETIVLSGIAKEHNKNALSAINQEYVMSVNMSTIKRRQEKHRAKILENQAKSLEDVDLAKTWVMSPRIISSKEEIE